MSDEILSKALALLHTAPTMYRACCAAFQALNQRVRLPNVDADALSLLHRVRRETELLGWGAEDEEAPTPPRACSHMEALCEQLAERAVKDADGPPVYVQCPVCHAIARVGPGTMFHAAECSVAPRLYRGPTPED